MVASMLVASDTHIGKRKRTIVLIDGDYLYHVASRLRIQLDLAKFYQFLTSNLFGENTPIHYYASYDPSLRTKQRFFLTRLQEIGYSVILSPIRIIGGEGGYTRTTLDMLLAVDAISIATAYQRVVLVSGDSDFIVLLRALRAQGKETWVIALPIATSEELKRFPDKFVILEEILLSSIAEKKEPTEVMALAPLHKQTVEAYYLARGQYFANYVKIREILQSAKQRIIIVDNYIDEEILYTVSILNPGVQIRIITKRIQGGDFLVLLKKLQRERRDVAVYRSEMFHDRFIICDATCWHLGHSLKDLGTAIALIDQITQPSIFAQLEKDVETIFRTCRPIG
jgi:uncharacterized LabA/DUF88 family protein